MLLEITLGLPLISKIEMAVRWEKSGEVVRKIEESGGCYLAQYKRNKPILLHQNENWNNSRDVENPNIENRMENSRDGSV